MIGLRAVLPEALPPNFEEAATALAFTPAFFEALPDFDAAGLSAFAFEDFFLALLDLRSAFAFSALAFLSAFFVAFSAFLASPAAGSPSAESDLKLDAEPYEYSASAASAL